MLTPTCAVTVPRVDAGSSVMPTVSRKPSLESSAAVAGMVPSMRNATRAETGFGWVSGTSNTPLATFSLRPVATSAVPRPILTTALRPTMRTVRSASRIAGKVGIGRTVVPLVSMSIERPSSGVGGPSCLKTSRGALPAMTARSTIPPEMCSSAHARTSAAANIGQIRFMADTGMRVHATPKAMCGSGQGHADIVLGARVHSAEIALVEIDAFARGINARADGETIDRQAFLVGRWCKNDGIDNRVTPIHVKHVVGLIDNRSRIGDQLALHRLRRAIPGNLGTHARRQGNIDVKVARIEPQREDDVARRNLSRFDADCAHAIRERPHRGTYHPGSFLIVGLEPEDDSALTRPG